MTIETKNLSQLIEMQPARKIPTWETELQNMKFDDLLLQKFPEMMRDFLSGEGAIIRDLFNTALSLTHKKYRNDAPELIKSLVMGCVLTEYKVDDAGSDLPFPRRKSEFRTIDDQHINIPSYTHALRIYVKSLREGADAMLVKAAPLHDTREDSQFKVSVNGQDIIIKGDAILDIIRQEFKDGPEVALLVEAVSKYDEIPENMATIVRSHFFYKQINIYLKDYLDTIKDNQEELKKIDESILKAISSVVKLQLTILKNTETPDEYRHMLAKAFFLKFLDINDNLKSPGTKPPILFRDRMFITIARFMNSPLADEMLINMGLHYEDDPLFKGMHLKEVIKKRLTRKEKTRLKKDSMQMFEEWLQIKPQKTIVGLPVRFYDENVSVSAPQIILRFSKKEIQIIRDKINSEDYYSLKTKLLNGKAEEDVLFTPYDGVHENILNVVGQDGMMLILTQLDGTQLYMRIIEDVPDYAEYALRNHSPTTKAPAAKIFEPLFINDSDEDIIRSYLNSRGVSFDPRALLLDPSIAMYVSENGVLSCDINTPFDEICRRLGVDPTDRNPLHILDKTPPDLADPNELHIYMIKPYAV